jgi:hypothetical protein
MTAPVWINLILAVPFVLAIVGIPLWMTLKHTDTAPDFSSAREYLAAKRRRRTAPATIRPQALADILTTGSGQSASHSELASSRSDLVLSRR